MSSKPTIVVGYTFLGPPIGGTVLFVFIIIYSTISGYSELVRGPLGFQELIKSLPHSLDKSLKTLPVFWAFSYLLGLVGAFLTGIYAAYYMQRIKNNILCYLLYLLVALVASAIHMAILESFSINALIIVGPVAIITAIIMHGLFKSSIHASQSESQNPKLGT